MTVSDRPEARLLTQCLGARRELAALLAEACFLEHAAGPDLQARFLRRFGWMDYENLILRWQIARLRKKIGLLTELRSTGKPVYLPAVEYQLDTEMLDWNRRLHGAREQLREAEAAALFERSALRRGDFHAAFCDALEQLHPQTQPALDGDRQRLWELLLQAYIDGNEPEITEIRYLACEVLEDELRSLSEQGIRTLLQKLHQATVDTRNRNDSLKSTPPMTYSAELNDEAKADAQIQLLQAQHAEIALEMAVFESELLKIVAALEHE